MRFSDSNQGKSSFSSFRPVNFFLKVASLILLGLLALPDEAPSQTFLVQGPAPITDGGVVGMTNNPVVGAIQAIAPDPKNAKTIYVGAVNGGVWKTTDGGANWTALTDSQTSLSVGALTLDTNNPERLLAGIGIFSNGRLAGGFRNGLLFSDNAGTSWTPMGGLMLKNTNISSLLFQDQFILAASRSDIAYSMSPAAVTGVFRSLDGGKSFIPISGCGGLPTGSVTSLAWSGSTSSAIYAAVQNQGIYRSDNGGTTWTDITTTGMNIKGGNPQNIQLSVGADGKSLYAGIVNSLGILGSVWRSTDQGKTWQNMGGNQSSAPLSKGLPGTIESGYTPPANKFFGIHVPDKEEGGSGQGDINFAIQADPGNSSVVYVGGQAQPAANEGATAEAKWPNSIGSNDYFGRLFRGDASKSASDPPKVASWTWDTPYNGQWLPITDNFANYSAPHADGRALAFDANGALLQSDDGGLYRLSNPGTEKQAWSSLNGNLKITEFYSVSYDSNTHTILGGAQDNGTSIQTAQGSQKWTSVDSGDGAYNAINDGDSGYSVRYFSSQKLGDGNFYHWKVDPKNPFDPNNKPVNAALMVGTKTLQKYESDIPFLSPVVLNQDDLTKIAFGTNRLYLATDNVTGKLSDKLALTDIVGSNFDSQVSALAYGRAGDADKSIGGNANLLLAGEGKNLWFSKTPGTGSLTQLSKYDGGNVQGVLISSVSDNAFYVADGSALRDTNNQGANWTKRISLLKLTALQFITKGVDAVVAGGYGVLYAARDNDLNNWYSLKGNLPNTFISSLDYSVDDDVLVVGTFGRGAFTLANASTLIPAAAPISVDTGWIRLLSSTSAGQTLNGGTLQTPGALANWTNNLTLTGLGGTFDTAGSNSTLSGVISGAGSFTKTGDGVLFLRGNNTYMGGTWFNAGMVNVTSDANLGAASGGLSFNGGALQAGADFSSNRAFTLNPYGGIFDAGAFTSTLDGVISGAGTFQVQGSGALRLRGTNSYEGGTILNGGAGSTLVLNVTNDNNLGAANGSLTLNGGTLQAAAGLTTSRIIAVQDNGATFDTGGFLSTFNGPLLGTQNGTFTQKGGGGLTLWGDGSAFSGAYILNSGTLTLNNGLGSNLASCSLSVNAGTTFNGSGTLLGGLALQGSAAAYMGIVSIPADRTLTGSGALNGTLMLKGDGSGYGGTYTVPNNSFCVLDNRIGAIANPANVNVASGGRINGVGNVVGKLNNQGKIMPGDSPGTMSISGNYTQAATGVYAAEIASTTSYDRIAVTTGAPGTGTASLAGSVVPTLLGGYQPLAHSVFPGLVTATGGITGTFNPLTNPYFAPTLYWQPRYSANSFDLLVQRDYANPGLVMNLNSNQLAVATMLNGLADTASGDLNTVLNAIDSLPTNANVQDAFKQISPEKAGALANLGFVAATFQMRNLANRTTNLRFVQGANGGGSGLNPGGLNFNYSKLDGVMLAYNGASLSGLFSARKEFQAPESRWGLFADGGAAFGSQNSTINQTGYSYTLGGMTLGADYRLRDHLLVGLATGYSNTGAGFSGSGGNVNTNTIPFNAYAAYFSGRLYAYGSLGYALNLFDLDRGLNFGGLSRTAKSSVSGHQFNAYGESGYDFKLSRFILTPTATLAYSQIWVGSFTEQGGDSLNLKVGAQDAASVQTGVGARLTIPVQVGPVKVVPQAYAFYQHEYANGSRGLNASLTQVGSTFNFQTDAAKRNFALVGANIMVGLKKNLYAQINYNAEVGRGNSTVQFINAGLRWEF